MTTPLRGETASHDLATLLVTGIADELAGTEAGPVGRACVVPGAAAWDDCCAGQLTVSPRRWFLSDDFPAGALGGGGLRTSPCDLPWLVGELVIQVVRCAPTPTDLQPGVPCDALALAARALLEDAYVVQAATARLLCELKNADRVVDFLLGEQATVGPEGGCVGTELAALVAVDR